MSSSNGKLEIKTILLKEEETKETEEPGNQKYFNDEQEEYYRKLNEKERKRRRRDSKSSKKKIKWKEGEILGSGSSGTVLWGFDETRCRQMAVKKVYIGEQNLCSEVSPKLSGRP